MSSGAGGSNSWAPGSNSSGASKLELSVSPQDGSLLVAPLSTVVGAAADSLYSDLHAMTYKEITIAVPKATPATLTPGGDGEEDDEEEGGGANDSEGKVDDVGEDSGAPGGVVPTRTAKMASLSFAQRRHELASRVAQHSRSIAHVAALVSWYCAGGTDPTGSLPSSSSPRYNSNANNSGASSPMYNSNKRAKLNHSGSSSQTATNEAADVVKVSSETLRHVRESWVQADEAQDALFFHHAELWKGRRHVHDILGAMSILSTAPSQSLSDPSHSASSTAASVTGGSWIDFPTDVTLIVDRYEHSIERTWSRFEALQRLRCAVRWKLFMGELGHARALQSSLGTLEKFSTGRGAEAASLMPWRVELESDGGAIRVTYGTPRPRRTTEGGAQSDADIQGDGGPSDDRTSKAQKRRKQQLLYPIEARLTVLSDTPSTAEWTLLSVLVNVSAKTGESNHQLELSKKQMFDLHRICVRAMAVEEAQCRKANETLRTTKKDTSGDTQKPSPEGEPPVDKEDVVMSDGTTMNGTPIVQKEPFSLNVHGPWKRQDGTVIPRPLDCLFETTHTFAISLQLEILSSQAEALRRGSWGGKKAGSGGADAFDASSCISVSPVHFFDRDDPQQNNENGASRPDKPIGVMAVHFWSVDDRHGSPKMGVLSSEDSEEQRVGDDVPFVKKESDVNSRHEDAASRSSATSSRLVPQFRQRQSKRLTLSIRATPRLGITVAMSGGDSILSSVSSQSEASLSTSNEGSEAHIRRSLEKLLSYIQNPFELSASDALLAATVICAERRCIAVVSALQAASARSSDDTSTNVKKSGSVALPHWIHLGVECGTITVAIRVTYDGDEEASNGAKEKLPVVAFGLACDSRTGKFVTVFPRAATLLRSLACNDLAVSEVQLLRHAAATQNMSAAALLRRRGGRPAAAVAGGRDSTGRIVRDAFEGLTRSMDLLGLRVGVGGDWVDVDASTSASLRARAVEVACADARSSLMTCAGMAAVYGFTALALGTCTGVDAVVDMAGGPIGAEGVDGGVPIQSPPVATVLSQEVVEKTVSVSGDETKKTTLLQRELFAAHAVVHDDMLRILWYDVTTQVDSPSSVPNRISLSRACIGNAGNDFPPSESPSATAAESLHHEVQTLAAKLHKYLGD